MPVETPRKDYENVLVKWERLRDCFKGRDAILKAGQKYVPDLPGADPNGNRAYRERGNFYNAVGRTVQGMNGAIFQEAPEVEMQESFKPILDDITLTNVPFETFATETGKEVFLTGRYGVLVDMPVQPTEVGALRRADVDMRPYCVGYCAENIINWRTERRGGDEILTMVVLKEDVEVPIAGDPFTCHVVCQYRVVQLDAAGDCTVTLWQQKSEGEKTYVAQAPITLMRRGEALKFVPFVFMGALSPTPDVEQPPLIDLADVNLGHWRNSVDHEYGLHLVALPTPWVAGAKGADDGKRKIGPSVCWELEANGSAGMLEFTGAGLAALVAAMDEKKKQMATLGARLLEDAPSTSETMGAVKLRHSGETASLKTVAQSLEQGFTQFLQICVWWQGTDAAKPSDTEVEVELNKEYLQIRATPPEIQVGLTALQAGEISFETWYNLLQTGGWAREGVTSEDEQKQIQTEKDLVPEPTIDPNLSPGEPVPAPPPGPKKKVVTGPDGKVKYTISEEPAA